MQVKPEIHIHNMIDVGNKTIIIATLSNGKLIAVSEDVIMEIDDVCNQARGLGF